MRLLLLIGAIILHALFFSKKCAFHKILWATWYLMSWFLDNLIPSSVRCGEIESKNDNNLSKNLYFYDDFVMAQPRIIGGKGFYCYSFNIVLVLLHVIQYILYYTALYCISHLYCIILYILYILYTYTVLYTVYIACI